MVGDELKAYVSYHLHVKLSCSAGGLFLILEQGLPRRPRSRAGGETDTAGRRMERRRCPSCGGGPERSGGAAKLG
jgi:hypothetical protein